MPSKQEVTISIEREMFPNGIVPIHSLPEVKGDLADQFNDILARFNPDCPHSLWL